MFNRRSLAFALHLFANTVPAMPVIHRTFGELRNERGGRSPIHPKRGTSPAKHKGHAKRRVARAARRRCRLARRA